MMVHNDDDNVSNSPVDQLLVGEICRQERATELGRLWVHPVERQAEQRSMCNMASVNATSSTE